MRAPCRPPKNARPQASSEIGDDVTLHSLMSRLTLLCLHFPRLRLIWSRSLHATADLFSQLKANQVPSSPLGLASCSLTTLQMAAYACRNCLLRLR